ncbi:MAG: TonB-dependent receptor, partial [Gemmatimonadota bacterium]
QIITKRGRPGRSTIDAHADAGANWIANPEGRYGANYYLARADNSIQAFDVQAFRKSRGFPDIFQTGMPLAGGASISGGTDQLRYYFSADYNRDVGPVDYNWQNKYSGRANLSYATASNKFKIDLSLGTVRSKTRGASGVQPITTSILWACNFPWCEPTGPDTTKTGWNGPGQGFQFYRPDDYQGVEGFDNIDRTIFSLQLNHRPTSWLRHRLTIGPDFTNNKSSQMVIRDPTGYNPFFTQSLGQKLALGLRSTFVTIDYGASADFNATKNLIATTSAGVQYYYKQFDQQVSQGFEFPIPGPGDVGSGARREAAEGFQENKTFGVYGQEQIAWKNRVFLTAALRADDNSAFGADFSAVYYPKFSLAWVLSDEPMFSKMGAVSQLKLRGAWGRAGQQPDVFSAIQTYGAAVGSSGLGAITPQNFGNSGLKPEVGEEAELGFDAGLFNQRIGIEFTFYNKDLKDAIISAPLRPSRGFPGVQFLNIGKTRNRGIEVALDGSVVNSRKWGLELRGTIATNNSKILDLGGVPATFVGSSYIQQFNVQGFAPQSFFYKRVKSATLTTVTTGPYTLPLATNPMCEGGTDLGAVLSTGKPDPKAGVGDGSTVACGVAPRLYAGRPTPSWNGSFSTTLRLGQRLRILGLLDYVGGHTAVVGDVGAQHTFFRNSRASLEGNPIVEALRLDPNGPGSSGLFNAGFARLRTVSATYDLPNKVVSWIGASRGAITVAAENMAFLWRAQKTSFGAPWIDPELLPNRSTDVTGNFGYTQESWPQLARVRTTFRFTF